MYLQHELYLVSLLVMKMGNKNTYITNVKQIKTIKHKKTTWYEWHYATVSFYTMIYTPLNCTTKKGIIHLNKSLSHVYARLYTYGSMTFKFQSECLSKRTTSFIQILDTLTALKCALKDLSKWNHNFYYMFCTCMSACDIGHVITRLDRWVL